MQQHIDDIRDMLMSKEPYSVMNQIHTMLWYASIVELLKTIPDLVEQSDSNPPYSPIVYNLTIEWYVQSHLSAVRRLLDSDNRSSSLRRVRTLFTQLAAEMRRVDYLALHGFHDSLEAIEKKYFGFLKPGIQEIPQEINFRRATELVKLFNIACGTSEESRSDEDRVSSILIEGIDSKLSELSRIQKHVSKRIAHADIRVYTDGDLESIELTYGDLSSAIEILSKLAFFYCAFLFGHGYSFPPITYNLQDTLFNKIAGAKHADLMQRTWESFWDEVNSYREYDWDWLFGGM